MKNRATVRFSYLVISIIASVLFCHFSTVAFGQDDEKISLRSYASVKRKLVIDTDTRKMSPVEGQPVTRKVIRDFVLYNYAHLADDIISGEGMYIETLYYLLGIEEEEKGHCQKGFLRLLLENKRIPDFSECIARYSQKD